MLTETFLLDRWFDGRQDEATLALLERKSP